MKKENGKKKGNKNVGFEFIKAAGAVLGGVGGAAGGIAITTACDLSGFAKYAVVIGTTLGGTAGGYALGYGITYLVSRSGDDESPTVVATESNGTQRAITQGEYQALIAHLAQNNPDALNALHLVPPVGGGAGQQQQPQQPATNQASDLEDQIDDLRDQIAQLVALMQQGGQQTPPPSGGKLTPEGKALSAKIARMRKQGCADGAIVDYFAAQKKYEQEIVALKALYKTQPNAASLVIRDFLANFIV